MQQRFVGCGLCVPFASLHGVSLCCRGHKQGKAFYRSTPKSNVAALPRSSNSTSGYQHSPILQTVSLAPLGLLGIACGIGFGHVARTLAAMKLSESSPSFPMSVKMCQVSSVKSKLNRVEFSHWAEVPIHLRPQAASGSAGRCRPGLQGRLGKALVLIGTTGRDTPEVVA